MFPISHFNITRTPFYYYDKTLLSNTLAKLIRLAGERNYHVHYAVKANANPEILKLIAASGIGADCVSGGEIKAALEAGFPAKKIVFAGVGKADWEIEYALEKKIFCFNVESAEELSVIEELAKKKENIASMLILMSILRQDLVKINSVFLSKCWIRYFRKYNVLRMFSLWDFIFT